MEIKSITYVVKQIDGDYAHLVNVSSGEEILVAMALLPQETDEGLTLLWEDFTYKVIS